MKRWVSLALGACFCAAAATAAPWNRDLEAIAVWPAGGEHAVYAAWTANTEATAGTRDLSTRVELYVNGSLRASHVHSVFLLGGSGSGCGAAPPCGGTCGSWILDGVGGPLLCHQDCAPGGCTCRCGNWVLTDLGRHVILPGDDIEIVLRPSGGGLVDGDTSDDTLAAAFDGTPIGWDRHVDTIALTQTSPGRYEVHVLGGVEWNLPSRFFSLDLVVELRVDGVLRGTRLVPLSIENDAGQPCSAVECDALCGTVNGIPRVCSEARRWRCACTGTWLVTFEAIDLRPGDDLEARVSGGPGVMPTLPDTDNDDVVLVPCCAPVGVPDVESPRAEIGQNVPNPFRPLTSIPLEIHEPGLADVRVLDAGGRLVAVLLHRTLAQGSWSVTWDGRDGSGAALPAGTYFCVLEAAGRRETRRMTLLR